MRKLLVGCMGICIALSFTACKSSESAYKKAYEQAKQQELVETEVTAPIEVTPVYVPEEKEEKPVHSANVREEKVTVVSGQDLLKEYSVVCGSFGVKDNADRLKSFLDAEGYDATIAYNAERGMYRVIVNTFSDRASAERARDAFKARYPQRDDFQESWLLYRIY